MEGFFSKKETESTNRSNGRMTSCVSCGLYKDCENPKLKASGNFKKKILNIWGAPSSIEDGRGKPFQNKASKFLEKAYKKIDIDLWEDCLNTYSVNCFCKQTPSGFQIDSCRKSLFKLIEEKQPEIIVFFGDIALYSILGHRWKKDLGDIKKWAGFTIPDQELQVWFCPMYDPQFIMDSKREVEGVIFDQHFKQISTLLQKEFPIYKEPKIKYLEEHQLGILDRLDNCTVAFDYETTGLKPYGEGHEIICASVAYDKDRVYSFMMPKSRKLRKPFTDLLKRSSVKKIAQNMKYEDTWSNIILRTPVYGWDWDTMQATHIIDNRQNITGLKFQTYIQFGVIDYDSEVSPYLRSLDSKDNNAFNRINELIEKPGGKDLLLKYCAYDSINEYRLAEWQKTIITEKQPIGSKFGIDIVKAYDLFHKGILALAKAERQGLRIDVEYCQKERLTLNKQIKELEDKIFASAFYRHWAHVFKGKPNLNSGDQLGKYLYDIKKITPPKYTENGKGSTDDEALRLLNIPELNWILERTKIKKIKTYLEAFEREQTEGYLHPFFHLHLVKTYRSSSDSPNFQNIPKRDEVAMKTVRKAIYPRPGNQLLEIDFKGIEVAIAACYHKDPNMIKYITDPKSDMHGDTAKDLFIIKDFDKKKPEHSMLRAAAKNSFVFPQFYGDYYKNCAMNVCSNWVKLSPEGNWTKKSGVPIGPNLTIGEHMVRNGIKNLDDFISHVQKYEKTFWGTRFKAYAEWKENHYSTYLRYGYVPLKTGFTCSGLMGKNDVINYPVQGAAFHCLLWLFIQLTSIFEEREYKTKLVGQIHDAIVLDVYPLELLEVNELIQHWATVELSKAFPWIIVPLEVEAELCPIDGSWAEKKGWKPNK